jgi:hypothetical protein
MLPIPAGNNPSGTRTGAEGNQPVTGFSEGNESFQIYNDTGVHKTIFAVDENITVNITSDLVDWTTSGGQRRNRLRIFDYTGNTILDYNDGNAFTKMTLTPPYVYEATIPAPGTADHYLLYARIQERNNVQIEVWDVIEVGGGATPPKLIETYSDSALTTMDWTFGTGDTVYIKVHTPLEISPANSLVELADYLGNSDTENIENLIDPLPTKVDQNSTIAYHLYEDVDLTNNFPNDRLEGDYWYTLMVDLEDLTSGQMANDWAAQILILPPPIISLTDCYPTDLHAVGPNTTIIFTEFYDADATGINDFQITFRVRDPNGDIITIMDNQTHGNGGLTITALGGNRYNASYTWNPPDDLMFGAYDLYTRVFDNLYGLDIDDFDNNQNELNILRSGDAPVIEVGNITCIPDSINVMTNDMVLFLANFSDPNDPPLNINDFTVSFSIRDESNTEIIIADNKYHLDQGDVAGSGVVLIGNYAQNYYSATISWNPDVDVPAGKYDLFFSVFNGFGRATDGYGNNNDELELYTTGYAPDLTVGDTSCIPSSIDIIGAKQTMIFCEFTDLDDPPVNTFNVTFKVRPPSNQMTDVITIVDNKAHGGAGEFGNTVTVEQSGTNYVASYHWDPPGDADIGTYDLYFMVRDEYNNTAEDPYALNTDELELISSVAPPVITAGNTKCVPTSVNKVGSGTTKIYCEFTDSTFTDINDFNVTFIVRDPNDVEIVLVDNKPHGGSGEDTNQTSTVEITYSGTIFTAWYEWDPPITIDAGQYDLYFAVINKDGGFARDRFVNNPNELTIETSGIAPIINNVDCFPPTITVQGTNATTIFAEFTDADNPLITNFTVTIKVRGPNNVDEILLLDNKAHDGAGELGGKLEVKLSGNGYMASIDWDPVDDTPIGDYDLYFEIKDETSAITTSGFNINEDKLELVAGAVIPHKPTLKSGTPTKDGKTYNFTVTYTDLDDDAPNNDGVILVIGENNYKMTEVDPSDTDYTDGKDYYYSIELEDDKVDYNFKVTNAIDEGIAH